EVAEVDEEGAGDGEGDRERSEPWKIFADPATLRAVHGRPRSIALTYSRVMRAMFEIGISFGHTASHSPSFEQLPKPSASACAIMATTRRARSCWPCGSSDRCEIFALMKRCADAFLHAATHAPQPMHAAES